MIEGATLPHKHITTITFVKCRFIWKAEDIARYGAVFVIREECEGGHPATYTFIVAPKNYDQLFAKLMVSLKLADMKLLGG